MGNTNALDVVMEFIRRTKAGDAGALREGMMEDHVSKDASRKRFVGRDKMIEGWKQYFKLVAGYRIEPMSFFKAIRYLPFLEALVAGAPAMETRARRISRKCPGHGALGFAAI